MVVQYSDNILVHFLKIVAVFSIYGIFSATLFFFLGSFLMFLYVHRRLSSLRLDGYDENFPKGLDNFSSSDYGYEESSVLHNQYFAVLRALFYFYLFLWFLTYFGVMEALYLYIFFSLLTYLYLYARHDFRGYERSYVNKISFLDPRPGFFLRNNFSHASDDEFAFKFLEGSTINPFLDTRFQFLQSPKYLGDYGNINAFNIALTKDPHFLSKFLYYYSDIYIYNCIHNFWIAVSRMDLGATRKRVFKDFSDYVEYSHMRFYPTEHFGFAEAFTNFSPTATYIKLQTFLFNTAKDVYRSTASRAFSDSLYLRYLNDPFFRLEVTVSDNIRYFPHYKKDFPNFMKFRSTLEYFLLTSARLEYLFQIVRVELERGDGFLRNITSNFNLKVRSNLFQMFPRAYYFKWLSYFLSFFLTESSLNFRFKNILIPENWYDLLAMYRYKRKPNRSRAGLHFSRLGTGQIRYNTDYTYKRGILEFVFNSYLYPVNNRSKNYYYLSGFSRFSFIESFDFVNLLVEPFIMSPVRAYISRVRSLMKDSQELDFRKPLKVFEIRRFIRKSGDGMEPFLSLDYFMCMNSVSFVNDLGSVTCNDGPVPRAVNDFYRETLPVFSSLVNDSVMKILNSFNFRSDRLLGVPLFMDPNWAILKSMVDSDPSLKIYLRNLAYNKYSSEFYEWFSNKHSSKPFFKFYELSIDFFIKSPTFKILIDMTDPLNVDGANTPIIFTNYQTVLNRLGLGSVSFKELPSYSPVLPIFGSNKIKRSVVRKLSLVIPLCRKSSVCLSYLPPINLGTLSPFSALKFTSSGLLEGVAERSNLRILLRDPFLFFNKSGKVGKSIPFRRFLWSNIFLKPALGAALRRNSSLENFSKHLSVFLAKKLSYWLQDEYGLSSSYVNYIFSDLTIFRKYTFFSYKEYGFSENFELWADVSKNQFDITLWKFYLDFIFSDNRFYLYSTGDKYCSKFALSRVLHDNKASLKLLFKIKNDYILQFPTKYMNFMAVRSSEGSMNFGRGVWKLFVTTLGSLVYLLIKSSLNASRVDFNKSLDNFFTLLEQLKRDSKDYNYMTKHLFLTLDPLFGFKRMSNIIPDDNGLPLRGLTRLRGVDWWESIPGNTTLRAVEHILQLDFCRDRVIDKFQFSLHMSKFWNDSEKRDFVISLSRLFQIRLPSELLLKIFNKKATRATIVSALAESGLSNNLKNVSYSIFVNEFEVQNNNYSAEIQKYNDSVWCLDSFYGFRDLSNFFFSVRVDESSEVESHFSDARFFYTRDISSVFSTHHTPMGFRSRIGTFVVPYTFSLNSINNTVRSDWYYSLFAQKPFFHHERLSLNILNDGDSIFLNRPSVNIKFYKISFFYFVLYWFVKQLRLFYSVTATYSIKRYRFDNSYDPLRIGG